MTWYSPDVVGSDSSSVVPSSAVISLPVNPFPVISNSAPFSEYPLNSNISFDTVDFFCIFTVGGVISSSMNPSPANVFNGPSVLPCARSVLYSDLSNVSDAISFDIRYPLGAFVSLHHNVIDVVAESTANEIVLLIPSWPVVNVPMNSEELQFLSP